MDRRKFLKSGARILGAAAAFHWLAAMGQAEGAALPAPLAPAGEQGNLLDLTNAVVVTPERLSRREQRAVSMLVDEVGKRTGICWRITHSWPGSPAETIVIGSQKEISEFRPHLSGVTPHNSLRAEGFALRAWTNAQGRGVMVAGADERGVLFGAGGLLRKLRMTKGRILVDERLNLVTSPKYSLRGHQLGYRPKTNSYDGWTVAMWEQYIRDLAVFGTNSIELIPPRSDDRPDSPHFWLPPLQMMVEMSRIADRYGLDVWIWYPAMDRDYSDPKTVDAALKEWGQTFQSLPRVNAVFVPGGDPGRTEPKVLLSLLEKQTENLHRYHPHAQMWISPQSFDERWMNEFLEILRGNQPQWLSGVVFGPQISLSLPALRKRIPSRYPIRLYPDITHTLKCQFPVPDWDLAFALTEGREVINPRPEGYANIVRRYAPNSIGFISYSEGCNDDVNKIVWSSLAWNPETPAIEILREYSRYFIGESVAEGFAQGLLALERNWRAPLISNESVMTTLREFQEMEDEASPHDLLKWRFQQGLYRAYYDAYIRSRLLYETDLERQALAKLEEVRRPGVRPAPFGVGAEKGYSGSELGLSAVLSEAGAILDKTFTAPVAADSRTRILELGEALYQSIRMQLSVERYRAEAVGRGATLDTLDASVSNLPWLRRRIEEIRATPSGEDTIKAILALLDRTNPGPGGFYDDLGDAARQPHLVRGLGSVQDPEFRSSSLMGFSYPDEAGGKMPAAWKRWAESLYDAPLEMRYSDLDPGARYRIRVVYAGDSMTKKIRLAAGGIEIHGFIKKPWPVAPLEFDIPKEAIRGGELKLSWFREPGLGGNGRGCQVAEVWLIRQEAAARAPDS
ncbi:MAG TPA: hypothetical protein VFZ08_08890 [Terriglobia bacterium]|nr:hypothetical protein [Terriglobia bacterium]